MKDNLFKALLFTAAVSVLLLTAGIIYALVGSASEAFGEYGFFGFITNSEWIQVGYRRVRSVFFCRGNTLYCIVCIIDLSSLLIARGFVHRGIFQRN